MHLEKIKTCSKCYAFPFLSFQQSGPSDLRHFDPEFTDEPVPNSIGQSPDSILITASVKEAAEAFLGFSYAPPVDSFLWTFFFLSLFNNNNYYFWFCLACWWNCQLTGHLETEFAHFHHGSFAALISTTLFAGSFFEEHITLWMSVTGFSFPFVLPPKWCCLLGKEK